MPEPTTTATATLVAATAAVPALTAFGVPLGLRADLLIAGFAGSLVAIILLNTVPGIGDTWQQLIRTSLRRMSVAVASSLCAGYCTPLVPIAADPYLLGTAFVVGAGAQRVLAGLISRASNGPAGAAEAGGPQ